MNNTPAQTLIAECRELEIKLYGKRIELSMLVGDRESAQHWKKEMYAVIEARNAAIQVAIEGGQRCFFDGMGEIDKVAA